MSLCVGAPAQGEQFYNRDQEQRRFWQVIVINHVVLSAPRRLGKTSLLKKLIKDASAHQLLGAHLDISAKRTAKEVLEAILQQFPQQSIQQRVQAVLTQAGKQIQRVQTIAMSADGFELSLAQPPAFADWAEAATLVIQQLSNQPLLIVLDEFSVFIQKLLEGDREQAEQFLQWLRSWRQQTGLQCRVVLSGSIGLNYLLQQHGLQAEVNDCFDFELKAFSEQHAIGMLTSFAVREGWGLTEARAKLICEAVGWLSPYYLLCVLEEAINTAYERLNIQSPNQHQLLDTDIQSSIADLKSKSSRFHHWFQRLDELLPSAEVSLARKALGELSTHSRGLTLLSLLPRVHAGVQAGFADADSYEQQLQQLLVLLVEQGYLIQEGQYWLFQSPILREYWQYNHAV